MDVSVPRVSDEYPFCTEHMQFRVDSTISRSGKLYYFLLAIWSVSMGAQVSTTDHEVLSVGSNPSTGRFLLGKAITE